MSLIQDLFSGMDQTLLRNVAVTPSMGQQTIRGSANVVVSVLVLGFRSCPCTALDYRAYSRAQVRGISLAISHHTGRAMTVLTRKDRDSQSQRLQDRSGNTIACRRADVRRASAQQRQKLVVSKIAKHKKAFLFTCRPAVDVRLDGGKFLIR